MIPGLAWLSLGAIVAAICTATNDWRGVATFAVVSAFIPEDVLWGGAMNRVVLVFIVTAVIVTVGLVANWRARVAVRRRLATIDGWENWDVEQRNEAARKLLIGVAEDVSSVRSSFALFAAGVTIAATVCFFAIQDQSDDTDEVVAEQCRISETFRELLSQSLTADIRQTQGERDTKADEIISLQDELANRPELDEVPGFSELPESVRVFVRALSEDALVDTELALEEDLAALEAYDSDLTLLRETVDNIRQFNLNVHCP